MTETPNPHIVDTDTLTGEMRPIRRAVQPLGPKQSMAHPDPMAAVDDVDRQPGRAHDSMGMRVVAAAVGVQGSVSVEVRSHRAGVAGLVGAG